MAIDKYFDKFPKITYSNVQIVDITKRVTILEKVSSNPYVFYNYDLSDNERADQLSNRYYEDPFKSWIVYLSNKILDPYYEWYLNNEEFGEFITSKYGSIEKSLEKTYYYRNNWADSEDISVDRFLSLAPKQQDYWEPVYDSRGNIYSYTRRKIDWSINTNRIVSYAVANGNFVNNEICNIIFNDNSKGKGQIISASNNKILVQHTTGITVSNSSIVITANSYIYGEESGVNTSFTTSTLLVNNLEEEEEIYWSPVKYFDHETEKNEFNKSIRLIDNRIQDKVVFELRELLKQ